LYCALSPAGDCLATGAGDQKLKIWKLFNKK
jgi:WD40 repeat protein